MHNFPEKKLQDSRSADFSGKAKAVKMRSFIMKNEYKKPEASVTTLETAEPIANPNAGFEWDSNIFGN